MVDENPPRVQGTPAAAGPAVPPAAPAIEGAAPPPGAAATDPAPDPVESVAAPAPPPPDQHERWLRERFERDHDFTLSLMRLLLEGLTAEGRAKRFWRWLIDDYRSERRLIAEFGEPPSRERQLVHRVLAWLRAERPLT